jgi:hypothetical protein
LSGVDAVQFTVILLFVIVLKYALGGEHQAKNCETVAVLAFSPFKAAISP